MIETHNMKVPTTKEVVLLHSHYSASQSDCLTGYKINDIVSPLTGSWVTVVDF